VTRYRFGDDPASPAKDAQAGEAPQWLKTLLGWLDGRHLDALANVIEVLLWGALIAALGWLAWRYREFLGAFVSRRPNLPARSKPPAPPQVFGLDLNRETLPDDIAATMTPVARHVDDCDWHLERLYDFAKTLGASVLVPSHARYVVDLNRPPDDANLYPGQDTT
ncbi:N-formylglutamate amidohydrolase, partial [Pseudomonas sp. 43(2021)]|uniref:N-formylglutamate amidohydrolase n=1 Tax=Pseudomonas sp. 43(2021) TaxID=2813560 RepID=UPI001FB048DB